MGFHLAPLLTGTPVVYLSPLDFLADPLLWLRSLSDWSHRDGYTHVVTGGPPFALDLCVKKLAALPSAARVQIDLSGVHSIILGAEPIRASSLLAFADATADLGFSANAFMPAYGLAENVLHTSSKLDCTYPPKLLCVEADSLSAGHIVERADQMAEENGCKATRARMLVHGPCKWLVACGERICKDPEYAPGMRSASGTLLVVNPSDHSEQPDGIVGELWLTGKCVTAGYYNNSTATAAAYSNRIASACTEEGRRLSKASFYRTVRHTRAHRAG
jgi:acyl-CoA synthetase (AMP-forming)/AMP-acid ligase II